MGLYPYMLTQTTLLIFSICFCQFYSLTQFGTNNYSIWNDKATPFLLLQHS